VSEPEFVPSPEPSTGQHPFIVGLLKELPPAGGSWTVARRDKWLEMAKLTVAMIYDVEDEASPRQSPHHEPEPPIQE
jgi:hypothetical protein